MAASRVSTGVFDRKGTEIFVGDRLKWIRDELLYKSGPKKGTVKLGASEFIAGTVIPIKHKIGIMAAGHKFWCMSDGAKKEEKLPLSSLPGGLNFMSILDYIEVIK